MVRLIKGKLGYVLVIANAKGGVGKSAVTTNTAGELALRGYNVGIVDTDSQGNAALYLGMQPEDGLFLSLVGVQQPDKTYLPVPLADLVRQVPLDSYVADRSGVIPEGVGAVYLLPSYVNTHRIPYLLDDADAYGDMLQTMIEQYNLDFVLVDTAPTLSLFDGSIYDAADGFLLVTECAIGSLAGLRECYDRIERKNKRRAKRGSRLADVIGIVPNKFNGGRDQVDNVNRLGQTFGVETVFKPIPLYKTIEKSASYGQTVRAFAANTPAGEQILAMADRIEQHLARMVEV